MKKTFVFASLLLCFLGKTFAQKFQFGVQTSLIAGDVYAFKQQKDLVNPAFFDAIKNSDKPRFGYSLGVLSVLNVGKKWSARLGLNFLETGSQSNLLISESSGQAINKIMVRTYRFTEIVPEIRREITPKMYASAGVSNLFLINSFVKFRGDKQNGKLPSDLKNSQKMTGIRLGAGYEIYKIEKLKIIAEPRVQYFFTPVFAEKMPVNRKLYDAGVQISVVF
jgi:hypothetical protein